MPVPPTESDRQPGSGAVDRELIDAAKSAFSSRGWEFHEVPDHLVLEAAFDAHHTRVPLHLQVFPEIGAVCVVSRATLTVPAGHRAAVSELLTAANQSLTVGNFELGPDPDHCEILFRVTNLFPPGGGDPALIGRIVHASIAEMDRLTPAAAIVLRTPPDHLHTVNPQALLERDDLIPPPPDEPGGEGESSSCPAR